MTSANQQIAEQRVTNDITASNEILAGNDFPVYLTGASNDYTRDAAKTDLYGKLGLLIQPATEHYADHITDYQCWAADNGCFSKGGEFNESQWLEMLSRIVETVDGAYETCLFATAPDVFDPVAMKGRTWATLDRSLPVFPKIREIGLPAALVLQDGLEMVRPDISEIPWDEFDAVFIGGSNGFKLGYENERRADFFHAASERAGYWDELIQECHWQGKPIHVGRVNSLKRMRFSQSIKADSADGTYIAFGGEKNLDRIRGWFDELAPQTEPQRRVAA